jgi:hypothetical protein
VTVRMEWYGDQIKGQLRASAAAGLLAGAEIVRAKSQPVVPREHGKLAASAKAEVDPNTLIAVVSYDAERFAKLFKQHEDLTYRHPGGEQAKFLEEPLYDSARQVQNAVTRAVDQGLR